MKKLMSGTGLLLAAAVALAVAAVPNEAHAKKDPFGYAANQAAVSMFLQQQAQATGQAYNPYVNNALGYGNTYNPNLYNSNLYGQYPYNGYNTYNPYVQYNNQYNNPYLGYNSNIYGVNGTYFNANTAPYGYDPYLNNNAYYNPYGYNNQQFGNSRVSNLLRNLF